MTYRELAGRIRLSDFIPLMNSRGQAGVVGFAVAVLVVLALMAHPASAAPFRFAGIDPPPGVTGGAVLPALTESRIRFEHLTLDDGLSQSSVFNILQDRRGFMWFATEDGLNRYDGYTFQVYKRDPDDPYSLSDHYVLLLYEDQQGFLWVLTRDGTLHRYDPTMDRFHRYIHDPDNPHSWTDVSVWQTSHGVFSMYGDASGALWVGTYGDGLFMYDPVVDHFVHYQHDPEDPTSLGHGKVYAIYEDRQGVLWLGTAAGLQRYDPQSDSFVRYPYHDVDASTVPTQSFSLSSPYAKLLHEDREGNFWVATLRGLNKFDRETGMFTLYVHDPKDARTLSGDKIRELYEDRSGMFWIAYWDGGLDRFNPRTGQCERYTYDPGTPNSLSGYRVWRIYEDREGQIWLIIDSTGLDMLDPQTGYISHYSPDPNDPSSLSDTMVTALYEDNAGVMWFGTGGQGLNFYDPAWNKFTSYRMLASDSDEAGNNVVFSIRGTNLVDGPVDHLWVGTRAGLNYWDRERNIYLFYGHDSSMTRTLSYGPVWSLLELPVGALWVGTDSGLDKVTLPEDFPAGDTDLVFTHVLTSPVGALYPDPEAGLWVGALGVGIIHLDPLTGEQRVYAPEDGDSASSMLLYPTVIIKDGEDCLWIGTMEGLAHLEPSSGDFAYYRHDPDDAQSLSRNTVRALYLDPSGVLWVGSDGGGLERMDPETHTFSHYWEDDGLPNGLVYAILPGDDAGSTLWLSTNRGLSKFHPQTEVFRNYLREDGLQSNEFDSNAYYRAPDGELFFGGVNGITSFYPELVADNPVVPPVVLTSLTQSGEAMPLQERVDRVAQITLRWPHNFFEFEFAALSYSRPERNQYAYWLEGLDKSWNYTGDRRFGRYTNLPGGIYTLHLKGSNGDGIWNDDGATLKIVVRPPFWGTWWFRGGLVLVVLGLIFGGYRLRVQQIHARNRDLERVVTRRTAELRREIEQRMRIEEELRRREMSEAIAAERSRLARDLHDAVTQTLFSASLIAEALPAIWEVDREEGRHRLFELRQLSRGALAEMRSLLMELRPTALTETPLAELLHQLGDAIAGRLGVPVTVTIEGQCRAPDDVHIAFYRIAQEALNNVCKHAQAQMVTLQLYCSGAESGEEGDFRVELMIQDDGCGFVKTDISPEHLGLGIMEERAQAIGATLRVFSEPGQGTQVWVTWPAIEERSQVEDLVRGENERIPFHSSYVG